MRIAATGWLILVVAASGFGQRGALTIPRNLAQLTAQAGTIVRGHVVAARVEPHPQLTNLNTIVVTIHVDETLKGQAGARFIFRQFIWDIRDRYDAAGYRKGQEVLLLMNSPSQYGLSSPAGMEQGRFRIVRARGVARAVNGRANAGLLQNVARMARQQGLQLSPSLSARMAQHRQGPIALEDVEELIRQFARGR